MPTRISRQESGRDQARLIRRSVGAEIRAARVGAGASLREAGALAGISHAQLGRIERAVLAGVSVEQLSRACSAVGLRLVARAVPGAGPAVDAPQLALLSRFRAALPPLTPFATEVPLPHPGDLRAWDAVIAIGQSRIGIEAETRLGDIQALDRRLGLKLRDGGVDLMILVVSDTAHNREILRAHRDALRSTFPLDGRQILPALRAGEAPRASGIIRL